MRDRALWAVTGALLGIGIGCLPIGSYSCASDEGCLRAGVSGSCEDGFCAYPDTSCPSGLRYDELAGGGLADSCFEAGVGSSSTTSATDAGAGTGTGTTDSSSGTGEATSSGTGDTDETEGGNCPIPGCTDRDGDGHCAEPDSGEPDCDDANVFRWDGCLYLSPTGDDAADGLSPATAWLTFDAAAMRLQPGDSLVLVDGEYEVGTTGTLDVTCGLGGASVGTAAAPISIAAQHERAATVAADGLVPAARLDGCPYWHITGLHFMSADAVHDTAMGADGTYVMRILNSDHNELRRLVVTHGNRYVLGDLLRLDAVTNSLVEDSEFYFYNHNAVNVQTSSAVTLRRLYANSRGYPDLPGCAVTPPDPTVPRCSANPAAGGSGITVNGSQLIVENCASRNNATAGFSLSGEDSVLVGSLSAQDGNGVVVASWIDGLVENVAVTRPVSIGVSLNATAGVARATLRNITVIGSESIGFRNNSGAAGCVMLDWCETNVHDLAALDNTGAGLSTIGPGSDLWRVTSSVFAGNTPDVLPAEPVDDAKGVVRGSSVESQIGRAHV